jgi:heavy metal translocating P-type ATPase
MVIEKINSWQIGVVAATLLSIVLHFALQVFALPDFGALKANDLPLIAVIVICGFPLCAQIAAKVLKGDFGADMLAAIAVVVALFLEEYLAATLVVLMLSGGQVLEEYAMRKASSVLGVLARRMPSKVHRKSGDLIEDIELSQIKPGDIIAIYPHEICPVDAVVISGNSSMDESYLTGEPYLISKAPGTFVISGAINGEFMLLVRAEKRASDSRYASIMKVMQEAEQRRPKLRRLGDQLGGIFAPLSLMVAFAAWYFSGDATRFLAVLVIATPCPLLISIPISIISAISMAARHNIIIKDPTVLERLPTCRTAIFDKTGTLTYGKPELTEIITVDGVDIKEVLQQAASLERYSKHPLSEAILVAAKKAGLKFLEVSELSEKPGKGLSGIIYNHELEITSRKKLLELDPSALKLLPEVSAGLECVVLRDKKYIATMRFIDKPRTDSKSFIKHLGPAHQFDKIMLVSGDREAEVAHFAKLLGIKETLSSQTPEQKLEIVRQEVAKAPTLFMGDGINDAPALMAATVGIAFGQYSDATAEAAGAVIMKNSLGKVDELIHISSSMRKVALYSAVGGMTLSVIGMAFASLGYISPVMGALIQEGIDVLSIVYSLKLTWNNMVKTDY